MATNVRRQDTERVLKRKGDRRAFLAAAVGAAAGATAATLLPQATKRAEAGGVGEPLIVGEPNWGDTEVTQLGASLKCNINSPEEPAATLVLANDGTPVGPDERARALLASSHCESILGVTDGDPAEGGLPAGVRGIARQPAGGYGPGDGVSGHSGSGVGVFGGSESGPGVVGHSQSGNGVAGHSDSDVAVGVHGTGPELGILGESEHRNGARGVGGNIGVEGVASGAGLGVQGLSENNAGVCGGSQNSAGVQGWTEAVDPGPDAILGPFVAGVLGVAPSETPGIRAVSGWHGKGAIDPDGGVALAVLGKARFSTAGSAVMPARSNNVPVSNPPVTADSHITVTFTGHPGSASVAWVERQPGSGFVIHLSGRPRWEVPFTYLIVEPMAPVTP